MDANNYIKNKPQRDATIDILRGIAILTMVCANSAAYILREPHPLAIRLYGTWAAPLFIVLAGFMVAYTSKAKNYSISHYILRGGLLLLCACMLDIFNFGGYPLVGFDVLYLIAFSIPLSFWFGKLKLLPQFIVITTIVILTPLLQSWLGYTHVPIEIKIFSEEESKNYIENIPTILKHWFIDGWFPIFPWLSFSFIGVVLANLRKEFTSFVNKRFVLAGLGCFVTGLATWFIELKKLNTDTGLSPYIPLFDFHKLFTREGYSEMFYPPTIGYILVALGIILFLFILVDRNNELPLYKPMAILGQCSLFMYLFHYSLIQKFLSRIVPEEQLAIPQFLLVYLVFMIVLILVGWLISLLKLSWQNPPYLVKFLLGG